LFKEKDAPLLDAEQLERVGKVTQRAVQTRIEVEAMHEDAERREREKEKDAEKTSSQPQKSQRERTLELVRRVDEIMGIRRPEGFYDPTTESGDTNTKPPDAGDSRPN
jgi:hypothetical protein